MNEVIISPLHTHSFFLHLSSFSLSFCNKEIFKANIYVYIYIFIYTFIYTRKYIHFITNLMIFHISYFFRIILQRYGIGLSVVGPAVLKSKIESHWLQVFIKISKLSNGAPVIIRVSSKMSTVAVHR